MNVEAYEKLIGSIVRCGNANDARIDQAVIYGIEYYRETKNGMYLSKLWEGFNKVKSLKPSARLLKGFVERECPSIEMGTNKFGDPIFRHKKEYQGKPAIVKDDHATRKWHDYKAPKPTAEDFVLDEAVASSAKKCAKQADLSVDDAVAAFRARLLKERGKTDSTPKRIPGIAIVATTPESKEAEALAKKRSDAAKRGAETRRKNREAKAKAAA